MLFSQAIYTAEGRGDCPPILRLAPPDIIAMADEHNAMDFNAAAATQTAGIWEGCSAQDRRILRIIMELVCVSRTGPELQQ